MKEIILFGIGCNGQNIVSTYKKLNPSFHIRAIADNHSAIKEYENIPVISPDRIAEFDYDEIWIATIYYKEIKNQLISEYQIVPDVIKYVDFPGVFLEEKIYQKYKDEIQGSKECKSEELQMVIDYVKKNGVKMYCYDFFNEYQNKEYPVFFDSEHQMFYADYLNHRMYLSRKYDTMEKALLYYRFTCMEQDKRSPHCYCTKEFQIEKDQIGIDIGAAEGIFALNLLNSIKHIYLIEADQDWCDALALTFQNDQDKVTIIRKFVSDTDADNQITLNTYFSDIKVDFIKMDIEGAERKALFGSEKILEECHPKLAVCTYHNESDNETITDYLKKKGYNVKNSKGYVICQGEWELFNLEEVDFRRALLWAERIRNE